MKGPTFFEGVLIALAGVMVVFLAPQALALIFGLEGALKATVSGLGMLYVIYLLIRSGERVGRITTLTIWLALNLSMWMMEVYLPTYFLGNLAFIWLVRSIYFHTGPLAALLDLGLIGLSLLAGAGAYLHTNNLLWGIWCFLLLQALFPYIPKQLGKSDKVDRTLDHDPFMQAHRAAEAALRKLASDSKYH